MCRKKIQKFEIIIFLKVGGVCHVGDKAISKDVGIYHWPEMQTRDFDDSQLDKLSRKENIACLQMDFLKIQTAMFPLQETQNAKFTFILFSEGS